MTKQWNEMTDSEKKERARQIDEWKTKNYPVLFPEIYEESKKQ